MPRTESSRASESPRLLAWAALAAVDLWFAASSLYVTYLAFKFVYRLYLQGGYILNLVIFGIVPLVILDLATIGSAAALLKWVARGATRWVPTTCGADPKKSFKEGFYMLFVTAYFAWGLIFIALQANVDPGRWYFPLIVSTSINFLLQPSILFLVLDNKLVRESEYEKAMAEYRRKCAPRRYWAPHYGFA